MARTKKVKQAVKAIKQQRSKPVTGSASHESVNGKSDNSHSDMSSSPKPNSDQLLPGGGELLGCSMRAQGENVAISDDSSGEKNEESELNGSATNEEANVDDDSAITDDLDISGVAALMTDDSETSSIVDLTESINKTEGNSELANGGGDEQQGLTTARRKSIKKPLKRLVRTTTTPRYDIVKDRTSKGTPYFRKVSSTNHRNHRNEMKISTAKKGRVAEEIKKSANVKRVTFNNSPSMKASSSAAKLNHPKPKLESTHKQQSSVKIPNFKDIHQKMFEKMESIDVTHRKREERKAAASSKKENKDSSQVNGGGKSGAPSTKSKNVVRKLDNTQPGPSKYSQAVNEFPKSVQSKSFRTAPMVGVLQERSNRDGVFKFTGNSSDSKIAAQLLPVKKIVENRSMRRQQAYKARPVPKTHPQNLNGLNGVRLNRRFNLQMKFRESQSEL